MTKPATAKQQEPPPLPPSPPLPPVTPAVNDQFWFNMSATMVSGSIDNLNKAIASINSMIVWGFTIYTGSSIFTVEFKKITEWYILVILLLPYLIFIFAYWQSIVDQAPITEGFDPRIPETIKDAYEKTYHAKEKELGDLKKLSLVALCVLAFVLVTAFWLKNDQKEPSVPAGLFGKYEQADQKLYISGKFPADSLLRFTVTQFRQDTVKDSKNKPQIKVMRTDTSFNQLNTHTGNFATSFPVRPDDKRIIVSVCWNEDAYKKNLEKGFEFKPYSQPVTKDKK